MKNKTNTETEIYYAAKNARRAWWKENGVKFVEYPFWTLVIGVAIVVGVIGLSGLLFNVGMKVCMDELKDFVVKNGPESIQYVIETTTTNNGVVWKWYTNK